MSGGYTLRKAAGRTPSPARGTALFAALLLSACAATPGPQSKKTPVHIEVEEAVGFTIVEESRTSDDTRADYERALGLLRQGRIEDGIHLLEAVADVAHELSAPRIDLAIAYHSIGELEAAEANLRVALVINPDHPFALNELGIVLRRKGEFAEARQSYEAALAVYSGYHYARRNLAVLCDLYLADPACALENYELYMATVPGDDEVAMWIADLRNRLGRQEGT